ncbi:amino acid ABC transporter substrate-binding protein [Pseudomonas sp. WHRI 8519]|uniref:amino acid ABC transporter substrate-binding protein n=1 Tax=Pseudomonas sp. WHRI 8519 TaxID=3162567 RepID=UPI0032EAD311
MPHKPKACLIASLLALCVTQANAAGSAIDKISETKSITLGYRESSVPFSYLNNEQKPIGYSIDLCSQVVAHLKQQLKLDQLEVKYLPVNSSNRMPLIKNGTIDVECGGTSSSPERMQEVAFSIATFVSQPRWLVKTDSGIKSASDLAGKAVVVTQGSNAVPLAKRLVADGLKARIIQGKDHAESMLMLEQGRASAFLEDDILLAAKKAEARAPSTLTILPEGYSKTYYGLMLPKGDAPLKDAVDSTLKQMMVSGDFVKTYDKWFTQPIAPHNTNLNVPLSEGLQERIKQPSDQPF